MKTTMTSHASHVGQRAAHIAEHEAATHVHEQGGNNHGPRIRQYLAATGLGQGYAWCMAFTVWCLLQAGARELDKTASVNAMYWWASTHNLLVRRPFRGDVALFNFYGRPGGQPADHAGIVARVLSIRLTGLWYLRTIEGNTSPDEHGSQADGEGVYVKRRLISRDRVFFARIPD